MKFDREEVEEDGEAFQLDELRPSVCHLSTVSECTWSEVLSGGHSCITRYFRWL